MSAPDPRCPACYGSGWIEEPDVLRDENGNELRVDMRQTECYVCTCVCGDCTVYGCTPLCGPCFDEMTSRNPSA